MHQRLIRVTSPFGIGAVTTDATIAGSGPAKIESETTHLRRREAVGSKASLDTQTRREQPAFPVDRHCPAVSGGSGGNAVPEVAGEGAPPLGDND